MRLSLGLKPIGLLIVVLPLAVQLGVVGALFATQSMGAHKLDEMRAARNVEILLGKIEVSDETALMGLTHFGITHHSGDVDNIMQSLSETERLSAELDEDTKKDRLRTAEIDQFLAANKEFVSTMRQLVDQQKSATAEADTPPQLPLGLMGTNAKLRRAIMENQIGPKLGSANQQDNTTPVLIGIMVVGLILNLVAAGLLVAVFLRLIMSRVTVVRHHCDVILQGKMPDEPLAGADELSDLDEGLIHSAAKLHEVKDHRTAVAETSSDVIFAIDNNLKITMISDSCAARWGFPADYMTKKGIIDLVQPEDKGKISELVNRARATGSAAEEFSVRHRSGLAVPTRLALKWNHGSEVGVGIAHDMTEGVVTTGVVEDREREQQALFKTLPVAAMVADPSGTISSATSMTAQFFGVAADDLSGRQLAELIPPERGRTTSRWDDLVAAAGQPVETLVPRGDDWVHYEFVVNSLDTKEGPRCVVSMDDVSFRHEVDRWRREIVTLVGSDLKAPLNSMMNVLQTIPTGSYGAFNEDGIREATLTADAVQAFLQMISDLSDIDRTDARRMFFDIKPVELQGLVDELAAVFEPIQETRKIRVLASPQMVPAIAADGARLRQAVQSICHHLVAISQEQSTIEFKSREFNDEFVDLFVGSNGSKLSPPQLTQIMNMYTNAAAYEKMRLSPYRLQVPLAAALLKGMGGSIAAMNLSNSVGYVLRLRKYRN